MTSRYRSRPNPDTPFCMDVPDSWVDETVYLFQGPTRDGLQHSIVVTCDRDAHSDALDVYATPRIAQAVNALPDAVLLTDDVIALNDGSAARRFILRWTVHERSLYQQNVCLVAEGMGFMLSATFTDASRREVGDEIDRIMRSFTATITA